MLVVDSDEGYVLEHHFEVVEELCRLLSLGDGFLLQSLGLFFYFAPKLLVLRHC